MRVVIGTLGLEYPGGTETYCITVARELDKLGHDVTLVAQRLGAVADMAADDGLDVARDLQELPTDCDAVIANDAISAGLLSERYPGRRLVYCVHSALFDVQRPPLLAGIVDVIVAPSERLANYARSLAITVPVVRLRQPIDTDRFAPSTPPRTPPCRALLLGNYLDGRRREALTHTWTAAGVDCVQVGGAEAKLDVRGDIAAADIVVGKARAALEGMACGKAVYVYDAFGGDGWVTPENYFELEADNFTGLATKRTLGPNGLATDLERYDPDMGWINRELAVTHHGARIHAQALIEVLRGPRSGRLPTDGSSGQLARVVRSSWRWQARALGLEREVVKLRVDRDAHASRTLAVEGDREAWRERALVAERHVDELKKLIETRRVRAGLLAGRAMDRLRGRP